MTAALDLTGQTFGRLAVLHMTGGRSANRSIIWLCRCSCGATVEATAAHLKGGWKSSCGCLPVENINRGRRMGNALRGLRRLAVGLPGVGYADAHYRVKGARGRASSHACLLCGPGSAAHDWALFPVSGEEPVWEEVAGSPRAYSLDVRDYHPLCRSHHLRLDRETREAGPWVLRRALLVALAST